MPCSTTGQDILNQAYGTSKENVPGAIATESTELLSRVNVAMRRVYSVAARVNPTFFGIVTPVVWNGVDGWNRPVGHELIFRLQNAADNSQIVVVGWDDLLAEPGKPAVYSYGQVYRPAGNALDPGSTVTINFLGSKVPLLLDNLNSTLDPMWPEQFNDFLAYVIALYLAEKDGRSGEVPGYGREIKRSLAQFIQFLEHETLDIRRRWGQTHKFNTQSLAPLMSILTGEVAAATGA